MTPPEKVCPVCARPFAWRRKWARCWDQVVYCSDACRRKRTGAAGERIERAILELLDQRAAGATICPSEAARTVEPESWRSRMPEVHNAARRLARAGRIEITKGGFVIDPCAMRGPVRLRLTPR
jgi:hypothetical protein